MTTFEEAKCCPKCGVPGDDRSTTSTRNGRGQPVQVHSIFCVNDQCKWYNTMWIVQVNPDGSIPEPYSQLGEKKYPKLSPESATRIRESIEAQIQAETQSGGAEIRNPRA